MEQLKVFAQKITESKPYRDIPKSFIDEAKEKGIVIVYGASDDLMEFDGAIYDEIEVYEGGIAYLTKDGLFENKCGDAYCPYAEKEQEKCKTITAIWDNGEWDWSYQTYIPHETFEMYDNEEKYCLGIVFYKKDLQ